LNDGFQADGFNITLHGSEAALAVEECSNTCKAFDTLGEAYYGMEIQCQEKLSNIFLMYERERERERERVEAFGTVQERY
jgi:hypothetical protein